MKKRTKNLMKQGEDQEIDQQSKTQPSEYTLYFKTNFSIQQMRFPKRTTQEISKLVNLQWKVHKQQQKTQSQPQKVYYQHDGYVYLEDDQKILVPQPPSPIYLIFQRQMREQCEINHPEYNAKQIDTTIQYAWSTDQEAKQRANEEYAQLKKQFEEDKSEFVQKYGFWPKKGGKTTDLDDRTVKQDIIKKVKQSSELGNPLSQMMMQRVPQQD